MLFAFSPEEDTYYVANGSENFWKGVPTSLSAHLKNDYVLSAISFGEDGAWFFKEAPRLGTSGSYCLSSATAVDYPRVKEIYDSDEVINWVAFGPNGEYVVDTIERVYTSDEKYARIYKSGSRVPLRSMSFGYNGSWVTVEDDGEVRSGGLSTTIKEALDKKPVRYAQLSKISSTGYFIEYVDGETSWALASDWHEKVLGVERMVSRLDEPPHSSGMNVEQRILFAFGHKDDMYCISNRATASWRGVADTYLNDLMKRPGAMQGISFGDGGAAFWKQDGSTWVSGATKRLYPEVYRIWDATDEIINWVAFGPQGQYIIDTDKRIWASRLGIILRNYKSGNQVPLRCGSFGYGNCWVVVEDDGAVRSYNLAPNVLEAVTKGEVRNIQLSMVDKTYFYVEYMDGTSDYRLPKEWHEKVGDIEGHLPSPAKALNNSEGGAIKVLASASQSEFNSIAFQFATSWRHTDRNRPEVRHVYSIKFANTTLAQSHKDYAARIGNVQKLWHGTSRQCRLGDEGENMFLCSDTSCSLCQILRTSYQKKFALRSGMYGTGIYSSTTSSKAAGYSKNAQASRYKVMILNDVAIGRVMFTNDPHNGLMEPPYGYDAVCGLPGSALKFDETCVYDDDAIRPCWLILYDAT